jgi:hypothetical protein
MSPRRPQSTALAAALAAARPGAGRHPGGRARRPGAWPPCQACSAGCGGWRQGQQPAPARQRRSARPCPCPGSSERARAPCPRGAAGAGPAGRCPAAAAAAAAPPGKSCPRAAQSGAGAAQRPLPALLRLLLLMMMTKRGGAGGAPTAQCRAGPAAQQGRRRGSRRRSPCTQKSGRQWGQGGASRQQARGVRPGGGWQAALRRAAGPAQRRAALPAPLPQRRQQQRQLRCAERPGRLIVSHNAVRRQSFPLLAPSQSITISSPPGFVALPLIASVWFLFVSTRHSHLCLHQRAVATVQLDPQ